MAPPTHKQIEARAYELYLARGGENGHALDDWLAAEMEFLVESADLEEGRLRRERKASAAAVGAQRALP